MSRSCRRAAVALRDKRRGQRVQSRSEALTGTHGALRRWDGVDVSAVVDALEVDRGDVEVAVAELALDDDQRDALMGHLHRMSVAELNAARISAARPPPLRRGASPHARLRWTRAAHVSGR
jgi:hypothetical protein